MTYDTVEEFLKSEEYSDELQWHEDLGYTRGYKDACTYFEERFKEHRYWSINHQERT